LGAICDIRLEAAKRLGDEFGVPCFSDVAEMLASDAVDVVTICTPSGLHLETALQAVEAGKHLLVEKPLEITTDRVDQIVAAGQKKGVKVGCVFQNRFDPLHAEIKQRISTGMLGEIYSGSAYSKYYRAQEYYDSAGWRGTWKVDGGGCLMNQGIHITDLLLWCLGDVESVVGLSRTKGRRVEIETWASGLISFVSGAVGVLEATTLGYPGQSAHLEIIGSRGTADFGGGELLRLDLIDPSSEEIAWKDGVLAQQDERRAASAKDAPVAPGTPIAQVDMGHTPVFQDFVDAIVNDREPLVNGEEARKSVELITSIYRSSDESGKLIQFTHKRL
jgi:predicted dehydrogenase